MTEAQEQKKSTATASTEAPDAELVAEYLRRHPDFFTRHPDLLSSLTPPTRDFSAPTGSAEIADFQQIMLARTREDLARFQRRQNDLLAASRTNMRNQTRVHAAALRLLSCRTLEHLIEVLTTDLTVVLGVDLIALCIEAGDVPRVAHAGIHVVPTGLVDELLPNGNKVLLRSNAHADRRIYRNGAGLVRSEALLRVQVRANAPAAMLALGAREAARFRAGQSSQLYSFLAGITEHCIRTWVDSPA